MTCYDICLHIAPSTTSDYKVLTAPFYSLLLTFIVSSLCLFIAIMQLFSPYSHNLVTFSTYLTVPMNASPIFGIVIAH